MEGTEPEGAAGDDDESLPPEEMLEKVYRRFRANLENELLDRLENVSPEFFERLVVDLLLKMGYGGNREDAGKAVGRTGDGGIDGVIKEDRLGLDVVYIQAKRWTEGVVGRSEVQKFVGALHGRHAKKGVFITLSDRRTPASMCGTSTRRSPSLTAGNWRGSWSTTTSASRRS